MREIINEKIKLGRQQQLNNSLERYKKIIDSFLEVVNYYFINNETDEKVFELPDYSPEFFEAFKKVAESEEQGFSVEKIWYSSKKVKIYLRRTIDYHYNDI